MPYDHILYEIKDRVAVIRLNRPETLNALTPTMRHELLDAITTSDDSDDVRVIIITGEGRGFCSGGDVKAMN
ncbi:MAG: enoyl-CoA hydratase/isomerase family protein, partial [Proteobacteria bacterium]|nr:enoyl-CoA hydratase/isomerase family protein [Pseudomonadota bacterium]